RDGGVEQAPGSGSVAVAVRMPVRAGPPERLSCVGLRDLVPKVVPEREPLAGGLGGSLAAETLPQIPVHPLVEVEVAKDLAGAVEGDALGQPDEAHPLAR